METLVCLELTRRQSHAPLPFCCIGFLGNYNRDNSSKFLVTSRFRTSEAEWDEGVGSPLFDGRPAGFRESRQALSLSGSRH
jgi:hypothetical protein